ncbi:MAG: hypothetical protein K0S27_954 [Gammaproteobacteria bacterium]|jgi:hypothetical protein|nr:hypothetical protein [Gammaproteobacteria bacterium]
MQAMIKIFIIFGGILILSGCKPVLDYSYLMQHPDVLHKEYVRCRGQSSMQCEGVVRAAEDFRMLVQQRSENPELFGLEIMQAQQKGEKQKVKIFYAVVKETSVE